MKLSLPVALFFAALPTAMADCIDVTNVRLFVRGSDRVAFTATLEGSGAAEWRLVDNDTGTALATQALRPDNGSSPSSLVTDPLPVTLPAGVVSITAEAKDSAMGFCGGTVVITRTIRTSRFTGRNFSSFSLSRKGPRLPNAELMPAGQEEETMEDEKPVMEEEKPGMEEEKPGMEEEKPVIEEEKPMMEEENPTMDEEVDEDMTPENEVPDALVGCVSVGGVRVGGSRRLGRSNTFNFTPTLVGSGATEWRLIDNDTGAVLGTQMLDPNANAGRFTTDLLAITLPVGVTSMTAEAKNIALGFCGDTVVITRTFRTSFFSGRRFSRFSFAAAEPRDQAI